jgi:hypothetical protein
MTQLTIKVNGELVRMGLQDLSAELPKIGRRQIRTVMNRIVRRQQAYPGERPGQTYKRTGKLFYSWKIEEVENGYRISNTAARKGRSYAQYVVGDAYGTSQAWMHKGRWELTRDVVDQEIEKLPQDIEDEIIMVARRINL